MSDINDREDFHPAKGLVETLVHGGHDEMAEEPFGQGVQRDECSDVCASIGCVINISLARD